MQEELSQTQGSRVRARDLGITIGRLAPGPWNAITDVPGVKVGHTTLIEGEGPLVLVSSATATPQRLYAGFARALVAAGARAVLTYDYRATGRSPRGSSAARCCR